MRWLPLDIYSKVKEKFNILGAEGRAMSDIGGSSARDTRYGCIHHDPSMTISTEEDI